MTISLRLDERLRLAGALLAAGAFPEQEQAIKAYKPHRVAERARRWFAPFGAHPAVQAVDAMLAATNVDTPRMLYAQALADRWPAALAAHRADFCAAAKVEAFWQETGSDWEAAERELGDVLGRADLASFLSDLIGPSVTRLSAYPNLLYPGRLGFVVQSSDEMLVCQPPPSAWGTSPPWRYNERPDQVLGTVASALATALFERVLSGDPAGTGSRAALLGAGAAVLFLREAEDEAAGDQFMLMEKKARGWPRLPMVVTALAEALRARRSGSVAGAQGYAAALLRHVA